MKYYGLAIMLKDYKIIIGDIWHTDKDALEEVQKILLREFKGKFEAVGIVEETRPD